MCIVCIKPTNIKVQLRIPEIKFVVRYPTEYCQSLPRGCAMRWQIPGIGTGLMSKQDLMDWVIGVFCRE